MFKKFALGALLSGLTAVLILGAVIRTNAVSGEGAGETGRRGQAAEYVTSDAGQGNYDGRSSAVNATSGRGGRWAQDAAASQARAGQGAGVLGSVPQADIEPAEWVNIQGAVATVEDDLVEIRTEAGEVIPFEGRPLSYALDQGFSLEVGDQVTLAGFDEDGEFKIGQVTNQTSGLSIALRDASGRPGWAGGGRRG